MEAVYAQMVRQSGMGVLPSTSTSQMNQEFWNFVAERFNLMTMLRSIPVGIPSLMSGRSPVQRPGGDPLFIDITSGGGVLAIWLLLSLIGLVIGTFYYIVVSQATLSGKVNWKQVVSQLPGASVQVIALALLWIFLFLAISVPAGCMISFFVMSGIPLGQITLFFLFGFLVWLFFPLLFSAHGIVVYRLNMLASVRNSVRVIRLNTPAASLFFLMMLLISQVMDLIWRMPAEDSWFTLLGILGHAFVSTGLLSASFIFYRDANQWLQKALGRVI